VQTESMPGGYCCDFSPPSQSGVKKLHLELVTPLEDVNIVV